MTEEKWSEIKDNIKEKFAILEEKKEPLELKTGLDEKQKIGEKEIIIFNGPMGKVKLEYIVKPVVLDKKEHYSKRMGTASTTEYILSESEFVRRIEAYLWKDDDWQKVDASSFGG